MDFTAVVSMDYDALALDMVEQLTHEELIDFISSLDAFIADWGFTERLHKWAKGEHKMLKAEKKEYGY